MDKDNLFMKDSLVMVQDSMASFVPAKVLKDFKQGQDAELIFLDDNGFEKVGVKIPGKVLIFRMDQQSLSQIEDMGLLKELNDASILHNLRLRFRKDQLYTAIGNSILISVNPFKLLPLYTPQVLDRYLKPSNENKEKDPHIYRLADDAFSALISTKKNQSCIISGESGSGKTEATKIFLNYICEVSNYKTKSFNNNATTAITTTTGFLLNPSMPFGQNNNIPNSGSLSTTLSEQILRANPIMEAFGNAKTVRNNNSSRFGKWIQIKIHSETGAIIGASITNYLLEKSRICHQGKLERNYHIFYQLFSAGKARPVEIGQKYELLDPKAYHYLNQSQVTVISGLNDEREFETLEQSIKTVGVTNGDLELVLHTLSGILLLGNLEFTSKPLPSSNNTNNNINNTGDSCRISNRHVLESCANQLGISDPLLLEKTLCFKDLTTYSTEVVIQAQNEERARISRDVLAKAIYGRLFNWLMQVINHSFATTAELQKQAAEELKLERKGTMDSHHSSIVGQGKKSSMIAAATTNGGSPKLSSTIAEQPNRRSSLLTRNRGSITVGLPGSPIRKQSILRAQIQTSGSGGGTGSLLNPSSSSPQQQVTHRKSILHTLSEIATRSSMVKKASTASLDPVKTIGVLDIFGFESFDTNSFEQLCINYCNEKLQGVFNQNVLAMEKQIFEQEGLLDVLSMINTSQSVLLMEASSGCIECLENKSYGIFALLDEACTIPKATDDQLLRKLYQSNKQKFLEKPKASLQITHFTIVHYAGNVAYDIRGFIEKNKDVIAKDLEGIVAKLPLFTSTASLKQSTSLSGSKTPTSAPARSMAEYQALQRQQAGGSKASLGFQFKQQLSELLKEIEQTESRYVRCIKPNLENRGNLFDSPLVLGQLRYSGILEVCKIRNHWTGYPIRRKFDDILTRYASLINTSNNPSGKKSPEEILHGFLNKYLPSSSSSVDIPFRIGKTFVFLKNVAFNTLEIARADTVGPRVLKIQRVTRGFIARTKYLRARELLKILEEAYFNSQPINFKEILQSQCSTADDDDALLQEVILNLAEPLAQCRDILPFGGRRLKLVKDCWKAVRRLEEEQWTLGLIKDALRSKNVANLEGSLIAAKNLGVGKERRRIIDAENFLKTLKKDQADLIEIRDAVAKRNLQGIDEALKKQTTIKSSTSKKDTSSFLAKKFVPGAASIIMNPDLASEISQAQAMQARITEESNAISQLQEALKLPKGVKPVDEEIRLEKIQVAIAKMEAIGLGSHELVTSSTVVEIKKASATGTVPQDKNLIENRRKQLLDCVKQLNEAIIALELSLFEKAKVRAYELGLDRLNLMEEEKEAKIIFEKALAAEKSLKYALQQVDAIFSAAANLRVLMMPIRDQTQVGNNSQEVTKAIVTLQALFDSLSEVEYLKNFCTVYIFQRDSSAMSSASPSDNQADDEEDEEKQAEEKIRSLSLSSNKFLQAHAEELKEAYHVLNEANQKNEALALLKQVLQKKSKDINELKQIFEKARAAGIEDGDNEDLDQLEKIMEKMIREQQNASRKKSIVAMSPSAVKKSSQVHEDRKKKSKSQRLILNISTLPIRERREIMRRERRKSEIARLEADTTYTGKEMKKKVMNTDRYSLKNFFLLRPDDFYGKKAITLMYSPKPITRSLLNFDETTSALAVQVNRCILGYCGDISMPFPATLAYTIVEMTIDNHELIDEVYIQLCAHITNNMKSASLYKGWQLMCICLSYFKPSKDFELFLMRFLLDEKNKASSSSTALEANEHIGLSANFVYQENHMNEMFHQQSPTMKKNKSFMSKRKLTRDLSTVMDSLVTSGNATTTKVEGLVVFELIEVYCKYAMRKLEEAVVRGLHEAVELPIMDELVAYQHRPPYVAEICYADDTSTNLHILVPPSMTVAQVSGICSGALKFGDDERSSFFGVFVKMIYNTRVLLPAEEQEQNTSVNGIGTRSRYTSSQSVATTVATTASSNTTASFVGTGIFKKAFDMVSNVVSGSGSNNSSPDKGYKSNLSKRLMEAGTERLLTSDLIPLSDFDYLGDFVLKASRERKKIVPQFRERIVLKNVKDIIHSQKSEGYEKALYAQARDELINGTMIIENDSIVASLVASMMMCDEKIHLQIGGKKKKPTTTTSTMPTSGHMNKKGESLFTITPEMIIKAGLIKFLPKTWIPTKSLENWAKLVQQAIVNDIAKMTNEEVRLVLLSKCEVGAFHGTHYYNCELLTELNELSSIVVGLNSNSILLCRSIGLVSVKIKLRSIRTVELISGGREVEISYVNKDVSGNFTEMDVEEKNDIGGSTSLRNNASTRAELLNNNIEIDSNEFGYSSCIISCLFAPQLFSHIRDYMSLMNIQTYTEALDALYTTDPSLLKFKGPKGSIDLEDNRKSINPLTFGSSAGRLTAASTFGGGVGGGTDTESNSGRPNSKTDTVSLQQQQESILRERLMLAGASQDDIDSVLRSDMAEML